jgi:hypothetical protein
MRELAGGERLAQGGLVVFSVVNNKEYKLACGGVHPENATRKQGTGWPGSGVRPPQSRIAARETLAVVGRSRHPRPCIFPVL